MKILLILTIGCCAVLGQIRPQTRPFQRPQIGVRPPNLVGPGGVNSGGRPINLVGPGGINPNSRPSNFATRPFRINKRSAQFPGKSPALLRPSFRPARRPIGGPSQVGVRPVNFQTLPARINKRSAQFINAGENTRPLRPSNTANAQRRPIGGPSQLGVKPPNFATRPAVIPQPGAFQIEERPNAGSLTKPAPRPAVIPDIGAIQIEERPNPGSFTKPAGRPNPGSLTKPAPRPGAGGLIRPAPRPQGGFQNFPQELTENENPQYIVNSLVFPGNGQPQGVQTLPAATSPQRPVPTRRPGPPQKPQIGVTPPTNVVGPGGVQNRPDGSRPINVVGPGGVQNRPQSFQTFPAKLPQGVQTLPAKLPEDKTASIPSKQTKPLPRPQRPGPPQRPQIGVTPPSNIVGPGGVQNRPQGFQTLPAQLPQDKTSSIPSKQTKPLPRPQRPGPPQRPQIGVTPPSNIVGPGGVQNRPQGVQTLPAQLTQDKISSIPSKQTKPLPRPQRPTNVVGPGGIQNRPQGVQTLPAQLPNGVQTLPAKLPEDKTSPIPQRPKPSDLTRPLPRPQQQTPQTLPFDIRTTSGVQVQPRPSPGDLTKPAKRPQGGKQ